MLTSKQRERIRTLREEALAFAREGHEAKALLRFAELEKLEPGEPDWPRRAAECHRVLGQAKAQVEALGRAAERYMVQGLVPKAIATCKVILSVDPKHTETQQRLAALHGAAPARPAFENPLKRSPVQTRQPPPLEARPPSPPAAVAAPPPRAPRLDELLRTRRVEAQRAAPEPRAQQTQSPPANPAPEIQAPAAQAPVVQPPITPALPAPPIAKPELGTSIEAVYRPNGTPSGMFRITFPEPEKKPAVDARRRAQHALPTTPLFSELSPESLARVIEEARVVEVAAGSVVYRKNDPSDALFVIVSGAVTVLADGESRIEVTRLGEGEVFGETALVGSEPRLTTVEATERTELLRIERKLIAELVLSEPRPLRVALRFLRERLVQALALVNPMFTILSKAQRRIFTERFEFLQIEADSLLIEQGTQSPGLYVLLCGSVTVTRRENDREHVLSVLHAGSIFGEMSLLVEGPAMADVRSKDKAFAIRIPEWGFQEMGEDHPEVLEFLTLLAETRRVQNRAMLESKSAGSAMNEPAISAPHGE